MVKRQDSLSHPSASITHLHSKDPMQIAQKCAFLANEKKAENINVLDVSKLTSFADSFVICSTGSVRQAQAVARDIMDTMKKEGVHVMGVEGMLEGHWILVDLGDVVVHVFTNEARSYYDLDGFWADAPVVQHIEGTHALTPAFA